MNRRNQSPVILNIFLALICLVLFGVFAGLLVWNHKTEAAESQRLRQQTEGTTGSETKDAAKQDSDKAQDTENSADNTEETEDTEAAESTESGETAAGLSFWGDEFFTTPEELPNSYRLKLEQMLTENGYTLELADKTLTGAGTLSMMKMAGVSQEDLDGYIAKHQEAAAGAELNITETGIRDLTAEQTARTEADYIPVIQMGYYGGWNHDPAELAEQEQKILDTFKNKDKFIIIGVRPLEGGGDMTAYEETMKNTWGEHYISTVDICTRTATTAEGQQEIAQAVYDKLIELGYITKEQEG